MRTFPQPFVLVTSILPQKSLFNRSEPNGRRATLQMQGASGLPAGFSAGGGQEDEAAAQRRAEAEIARAGMLKAILAPTALARREWVFRRNAPPVAGAARARASRLHHPRPSHCAQ